MLASRRTIHSAAPDASDRAVGPLRRGLVAVSVTAVAVVSLAACGSSSSKTATPSSAAGNTVASSTAAQSSAAPDTSAATTAGSTAARATSGTAKPAPSSSMPAAAAMIMIQKFKYAVPASVKPGAMVSVMNMDSEAHTVTADKGKAFDDKATPGKVTTFKAPTTPGSYAFHCEYHSNMHGVLVVK